MNFFEQQDIARRNTRWLVLLFALAVIALITITAFLFAGMFAWLDGGHSPYDYDAQPISFGERFINNLDWRMTGSIALLVCSVVAGSSLFKFFQLRGGGRVVAESMGGQRINSQTTNADERKILNIVEEMAIASGTPVPPVYLLEDDAINAFAAGHSPSNAVIGVTRGCIRLLNRDELQGVVAHEFSHIFHGDMRLNMRLVAILHGILIIGLIGQFLLNSARYRMAFRSSKDNSPLLIFGMGIGLLIIGYAGTFFGNMIKAAVSRQREFLADASAVQFTRNPSGIAGALKKIRHHAYGSRLDNAHAAEFSHMYFSEGIRSSLGGLMATHPPLDTRISRIDKSWKPEKNSKASVSNASTINESAQVSGLQSGWSESISPGTTSPSAFTPISGHNATAANAHFNQIGNVSPVNLMQARTTLSALGEELRHAAGDPFTSRALLAGLFLSSNPGIRAKQWAIIHAASNEEEKNSVTHLAELTSQLNAELRIPLIELALPSLKKLSDVQLAAFKKQLHDLIMADNHVSLMEWSLQRIILHHFEPARAPFRTRHVRELRDECGLLLSFLAYAGSDNDRVAEAAFRTAATELRFSSLTLPARTSLSLKSLDDALGKLNDVAPLQKPQLLKAMCLCVTHDDRVTAQEMELLRAIADAIDCPVPPLPSM